MLGVGVGSGVCELKPPQERDELPPAIFLNAPDTFRPMPFMIGQKHVQLGMCYVSETEMKVLTHELKSLIVNFSCSKEIRERGFLKSNLSKNPMKTREQSLREFERE